MSQTTEVRPATTVLAIRPTIVLEAVAEGIKVTGSGWEQVVAVSQTGVRDAILAVRESPMASSEILRRALEGTGDLTAAVVVQSVVRRLSTLGVFEHVLFEPGNGALARLTTAGAMPVGMGPVPPDIATRVLSPMLVATVGPGVVMLESGVSHLRVHLRADLFARLVNGEVELLPDPVLAMLCAAQLLLPEAEVTSRRFRQWDPTDLWFHRKANESRGSDGYGGTYHLEGDFEPIPYARPLPDGPSVELPEPDLEQARRTDPPLAEVMEGRRSRRRFLPGQTRLEQLAEVLYRSLRARQVQPDDHGLEVVDRRYPSGGSVHEIDAYVVVNDVAGLEPGIYRYAPERHSLDLIGQDEGLRARVNADVMMTIRGKIAPPVVLLFGARFDRLMWKYQGMPYALLTKHVGVVYQTIYLNAEAAGLGVCGIGGTSASLFAQATRTHPMDEGAVGMMVLGVADPSEPDVWGRP